MILVDTSGLVALFDARDANHEDAKAAWTRVRESREPRVLTDLVIAETVTVLRRHVGFAEALRAGERLYSGTVAEIVFADEDLHSRGWELFRKFHDHELSVADCVSFALMRERRITRAFTFDSDFEAVGFQPV